MATRPSRGKLRPAGSPCAGSSPTKHPSKTKPCNYLGNSRKTGFCGTSESVPASMVRATTGCACATRAMPSSTTSRSATRRTKRWKFPTRTTSACKTVSSPKRWARTHSTAACSSTIRIRHTGSNWTSFPSTTTPLCASKGACPRCHASREPQPAAPWIWKSRATSTGIPIFSSRWDRTRVWSPGRATADIPSTSGSTRRTTPSARAHLSPTACGTTKS